MINICYYNRSLTNFKLTIVHAIKFKFKNSYTKIKIRLYLCLYAFKNTNIKKTYLYSLQIRTYRDS